MPDKLVTVKLDKERHLRLTLKGMLEFEKLTGKSFIKGFKIEELTLEETFAILWASLVHEDKELTFDDVLYMIDLNNMKAITEAITEYITQFGAEKKAGDIPLAGKSRRSRIG